VRGKKPTIREKVCGRKKTWGGFLDQIIGCFHILKDGDQTKVLNQKLSSWKKWTKEGGGGAFKVRGRKKGIRGAENIPKPGGQKLGNKKWENGCGYKIMQEDVENTFGKGQEKSGPPTTNQSILRGRNGTVRGDSVSPGVGEGWGGICAGGGGGVIRIRRGTRDRTGWVVKGGGKIGKKPKETNTTERKKKIREIRQSWGSSQETGEHGNQSRPTKLLRTRGRTPK